MGRTATVGLNNEGVSVSARIPVYGYPVDAKVEISTTGRMFHDRSSPGFSVELGGRPTLNLPSFSRRGGLRFPPLLSTEATISISGCQICLEVNQNVFVINIPVTVICHTAEGCIDYPENPENPDPFIPGAIETPEFDLPVAGEGGYTVTVTFIGGWNRYQGTCSMSFTTYDGQGWPPHSFFVQAGAFAKLKRFSNQDSNGAAYASYWYMVFPDAGIEYRVPQPFITSNLGLAYSSGHGYQGTYYCPGTDSWNPEYASFVRYTNFEIVGDINSKPPLPFPRPEPPSEDDNMTCGCDCATIALIINRSNKQLYTQLTQQHRITENIIIAALQLEIENSRVNYNIIANMLNQQSVAVGETTLNIVNQFKSTQTESFRVVLDNLVNLQKTLIDINEFNTATMYENTLYITDYIYEIISNLEIDTTDLVLNISDIIVGVSTYTTELTLEYMKTVSETEMQYIQKSLQTTIDILSEDTEIQLALLGDILINTISSETDYLYSSITSDIISSTVNSLEIIRDDIISWMQYYHLLHLDSEISLFNNLHDFIQSLFNNLDLGNNQNLIDLIKNLELSLLNRIDSLQNNLNNYLDNKIVGLQNFILQNLMSIQNNLTQKINDIDMECPEIDLSSVISLLNSLISISRDIEEAITPQIAGSKNCQSLTGNSAFQWSGLGIKGLQQQINAILDYLECLNTFNTIEIKGSIEGKCEEETLNFPYEGKGIEGISKKLDATLEIHKEILKRVCDEDEPQCVALLPGEIFLEQPINKQLIVSFGLEYPTQKGTLTHLHIPEPIDNLNWDDFENWIRPMGNVLGRVKFRHLKQPIGGYAATEQDALALCTKIRSLSSLIPENHNGLEGRLTKGGRTKQPNFENRTYRAVRAVVAQIGSDNKPEVIKCLLPPK